MPCVHVHMHMPHVHAMCACHMYSTCALHMPHAACTCTWPCRSYGRRIFRLERCCHGVRPFRWLTGPVHCGNTNGVVFEKGDVVQLDWASMTVFDKVTGHCQRLPQAHAAYMHPRMHPTCILHASSHASSHAHACGGNPLMEPCIGCLFCLCCRPQRTGDTNPAGVYREEYEGSRTITDAGPSQAKPSPVQSSRTSR